MDTDKQRDTRPAPTLIIGYGNPSRGDDALGPRLIEEIGARIAEHPKWGKIEILTDFQLQIEFVLDLAGRDCVIFVDAVSSGEDGFGFAPLVAEANHAYTTHALAPAALLGVYAQYHQCAAPKSYLLTIRGFEFALGADLSAAAESNLAAACAMLCGWLSGRGGSLTLNSVSTILDRHADVQPHCSQQPFII